MNKVFSNWFGWQIGFWLFYLGAILPLKVVAVPYVPGLDRSFLSANSTASPTTEKSLPVPENSKTIYLISGLAADSRMFENLHFPAKYSIRHLAWIEPLPHEKLPAYSRRLASQIDTNQAFVLVGMSFGGLVAIEMNKFLQPRETILISSVTSENSFSTYLWLVGHLKLHKLVPTWIYKNFRPPAYWFFNARTPEQKRLVASFMKNASKNLLKWSVNQLLDWRNSFVPENVFLINGEDDRVFPARKIRPNVLIPEAGHMMVYSYGDSISSILANRLAQVIWRKKP